MLKNIIKCVTGATMMVVGLFLCCSTGKKVVSVKTDHAKVLLLRAFKNPSVLKTTGDDNDRIMAYTPAEFFVTVKYLNNMYTIEVDENNYISLNSRVGTTANAFVKITKYDDGTKDYKIINVY